MIEILNERTPVEALRDRQKEIVLYLIVFYPTVSGRFTLDRFISCSFIADPYIIAIMITIIIQR